MLHVLQPDPDRHLLIVCVIVITWQPWWVSGGESISRLLEVSTWPLRAVIKGVVFNSRAVSLARENNRAIRYLVLVEKARPTAQWPSVFSRFRSSSRTPSSRWLQSYAAKMQRKSPAKTIWIFRSYCGLSVGSLLKVFSVIYRMV